MISLQDSSQQLLDNFDIANLPAQAFNYVNVIQYLKSKNKIILETGPYVGLIPLQNGDSIYIAPRIGSKAFSRMLSVVNNIEDRDAGKESLASSDDSNPINWINLVGRNFRDQLTQINSLGLRFKNVLVNEESTFIKGKVNYRQTEIGIARQSVKPISNRVYVKEFSTPENKLLSLAAFIVNKNIFENNDFNLSLWSRLAIEEGVSNEDYQTVIQNLNKGFYDDYRSYYIPALKTALLLIPNNLSGITFNDQDQQITPFLTNVNSLFEEYIRLVIAKGLTDLGYLIEKPSNSFYSLFKNGSNKLIPDVVVSKNGNCRAIVDMKYKPSYTADQNDYYQLKTYIDAFGLSKGIIVKPAPDESKSNIDSYEFFDGKIAIQISLNIGNYEDSEETLLNQLKVAMS